MDGWLWPPGAGAPQRLAETRAGELLVRHPPPNTELASALVMALRDGGSGLASIPVAELVEILGEAGEALVRGMNDEAVRQVAANARMSTAMVGEILDGMAASWNAGALGRLVSAEFPDPRVLDGFVAGNERGIAAAGPGLTLHLGAGTVPGVAITSMIRALLVKSAALVKPGAGDIALTVRFATELRRTDPRVGAAVAVQYWPGGAKRWDPWERELFRGADQVVIYGSDATVESVRARAPASTRLVEHPHRIGIAVIDPREAPGAEAEAARAAALFEQRGCVSTQLVFLIGDRSRARCWCMELGKELAALEGVLPAGRADAGEQSALHQLRGRLRLMRATSVENAPSAGTAPGTIRLWHSEGSCWTVILAPVHAFEPVGGRTVWVVPVPDLNACLRALAPLAPVLQTVGLAGIDSDRAEFGRKLPGLGFTRVVPLAQVPFPDPDWFHDGNRPLGELVRWCELR